MLNVEFDQKKKEIANYCKRMLNESGRSEKDVREELGWGMEKMADFLEGGTEFMLQHLHQFADCLDFKVDTIYKKEVYTAKDIALMILALPEELQNLELHQTADATSHFSPCKEVRVGYLNKHRQESSEGKRVLMMYPNPWKFNLTDAEIDILYPQVKHDH